MAGSEVFPWDVPLPAGQTVGWVIQGQVDEPLDLWLEPGTERLWEDARSAGKEPGQPVLFLQAGQARPAWVAWGRILEPKERWKIYGVRTVCAERLDPPLPVVASSVDFDAVSGDAEFWENRALGAALGLLRHRDRTPYGDVGARDLRLTGADLGHLVRAQPGLRRLGRSSASILVPGESAAPGPAEVLSTGERTLPSTVDLQQAEKLVIDDLKRLFGDEVEFSSLKATPNRFRGREYWVLEGSFWSNFVLKNFQYAVAADTGELAAKRVDRE